MASYVLNATHICALTLFARPQPTERSDALVPEPTVESAVEHAKRAFALKRFEQAVEHYANALELMCVACL